MYHACVLYITWFYLSLCTVCTMYMYGGYTTEGGTTECIGVELEEGECICPLSWSVPCNFVRDGK